MIFDTWGGNLSHAAYREFSLAYLQRIIAGLKREHAGARVPTIVFTKGCGNWLEDIAAIGCDAVGLDWSVDIAQARARIGDRVALQGNLDPAALFAPADVVQRETEKILASYGQGSGHVFNLGHGISQFTPPEAVKILVDCVHQSSLRYHNDGANTRAS